jgi:single-strand DNA-binding protein
MADFFGVNIVARLTADPEYKEFASGGGVLTLRLAWGTRSKNKQTGAWEKKSNYIDAKRFKRGETDTQIDVLVNALHKGSQVFISGKLEEDSWEDKATGSKRSKHVVMVDDVQFLDKKGESERQTVVTDPELGENNDGGNGIPF